MGEAKYNVGDRVVISKRLSETGVWEDTKPRRAIIVEIRDTVSLGPAHTLEVNGERLKVCYWSSDIDGYVGDKLYQDPDVLWRMWGDE